jgi:hypothetical protein
MPTGAIQVRSSWVARMFELIALTALVAVGLLGIRLSTDTPLDRVDRSLWPYLRH